MSGCRNPLHCVVPPYILDAVIRKGSDQQRAWATRSLGADHRIRTARMANAQVRAGGPREGAVVLAGAPGVPTPDLVFRFARRLFGNTPGSLMTKSRMSVLVTVPKLSEPTLAGGGNVVVTGITTESLTITLSGSGNLTGSGTAGSLDVTLSGSGNAWFTDLVADDVHAVLSGSGNIFVTASKSLDASVPGSRSSTRAIRGR